MTEMLVATVPASAAPPATAHAYEGLAWAFAANEVDQIHCLMGDANLELLVHASTTYGIELIHARHEQGAVAMADGYARATGRVGVCSVTSGPGMTNAGTSLAAAARHGSPLLLIAGDTPTRDRRHPQRHDLRKFSEALGVHYIDVRHAQSLLDDFEAALCHAASERGPVVLAVPVDIQHTTATYDLKSRWRQPVLQAIEPPPVAINSAARLLGLARRPALLAGRGAARPRARAAVLKLAETLGAPVVTTVRAKGLAHDHPLEAGVVGAMGAPSATAALQQADVICALGTTLDPWAVAGGALLEHARLIHVDRDPAVIGETAYVDVPVVGDAALSAAALAERLRERRGVRHGWWRPGIQRPNEPFEDGPQGVDPRRAVQVLDRALGDDRIVVIDGGHFAIFSAQGLTAPTPEQFFFLSDFGAIGQGLSVAIGVALGRPGQRVTAIVGDGCLMMGLADLETAVRYQLALTIVVLDDDGFGHERHSLNAKGFAPDETYQPSPDLARLARALGMAGHRIDSPEGLDELSRLLAHADGPMLIDVRINPSVVNPAAEEMFARVRASSAG